MLSDPDKRAAYDRQLQGWGVQDLVGGLVDDLLGGGRRKRKRDGRDVRYTLEVTFEEAALGATRRVSFTVPTLCPQCEGNGAAPGGTRPCGPCGGSGEARDRSRLVPLRRPCPHCGGQGIRVTQLCQRCGGTGQEEREREFMVRLPKGVKEGDVKLMPGKGEPGVQLGRPGDLHVLVHVLPHPHFSREGDDVHLELPISLTAAALGATEPVPTLHGPVRMKIPPGTQTGRVLRLRDKGIPREGGRGDQLVRLTVETPVALTPEQARCLQELERGATAENYPLREAFRAGEAGAAMTSRR